MFINIDYLIRLSLTRVLHFYFIIEKIFFKLHLKLKKHWLLARSFEDICYINCKTDCST